MRDRPPGAVFAMQPATNPGWLELVQMPPLDPVHLERSVVASPSLKVLLAARGGLGVQV